MWKLVCFFIGLITYLNASDKIYSFGDDKPRHPRIGVVTILIGNAYQKKMSYCTETKINYCKKHGYDLILAHDPHPTCFGIEAKSRHPAWQKITVISKYLGDYDWICHIDADTMIMNDEVKLESFIDDNLDLVLSSHAVAGEPVRGKNHTVNTGVWFIKNAPVSEYFLKNVWTRGENTHWCHRLPWEQPLMQMEIKDSKSYGLRCKKYPASPFNAHTRQYSHGDFLVHFYGYSGYGEATVIAAWKNIHQFQTGQIHLPD